MLLGHLNEQQIRLLQRDLENNGDANALYKALKQGDAKIFFSVDEQEMTIRYEAYCEEYFAGIIVSITREICDEFKPFNKLSSATLTPLCSALALYIAEMESSCGEDILKQRYGHFYPLFAKFSKLSPWEITTYLQQKKDLERLVRELDSTYETQPIAQDAEINATIEMQLSCYDKYGRTFEVAFFIRSLGRRKQIKIYDLADLATGKSVFPLSTSAKQGSIVVSLVNFSDEDKHILSYLPIFVDACANYYSRAAKTVSVSHDFSPLVTLLHYFAGREIDFDAASYRVEENPVTIKMFIDESGTVASSFELDPSNLFIKGDQLCAYFNKQSKTISFVTFTSQKARVLHDFYLSHPDFKYDLFSEEIGGSLLPRLSSDTIVDKNFEENTKGFRSAIKYYVTYNDDLTLSMSTVFSVRGNDVDKEVFLSSNAENTYNAFKKEIDRLGLEEEGLYKSEEEIGPILEADFTNLSRLCSLYLSENLAAKKVKKSIPIRVNAESGIDWFELSFDSDTLSAKEINEVLNAYRKKKKYVRIGDDYYALGDGELATLAKRFEVEEGLTTNKLPLYQALHLNHDGKSIVNLSKQLIELFHELSDYSTLELPLEQRFLDVLRPYQLDGVRWLYSLSQHSLAGILADDMGLGKSLEFISFLSLIQNPRPVLIVCPKSLIYNWESEFLKWDPSRDVFVISASKAERAKTLETSAGFSRPIIVVSYDTLRNDVEEFEKMEFSTIVLDEGQYIANAFAQKSKAVKSLKAKYRFVLTGTPIQNSFLDLWSIFDFLMPGYLDGYKEFQNIYRGYESVNTEEGKRLEKMVAPFLLRRKKDNVLQDLPPKTEEIIRIQFDTEEKRLYSGYLANVKRELGKDDGTNKIAILAMLTRLRQLCVDPSSFLEYDEISTKLDYVLTMVADAISGGHKVLIFSTFAEILLHLEKLLENRKIANHLIYGQTSAAKRLSYAEDFNNNPNVSVMLVSLKAGGTGLNLIGADIVIHLDPWWNIAAEEQATDRAHRIGQTRPVSVYKLIMVGSVEEKVIELQQKKKELTTILHNEGEVGASLTEEDLYFLLS